MKLDHTNINQVVTLNILRACTTALKTKGLTIVHNANSKAYVTVRTTKIDGSIKFIINDTNGNNIASVIAKKYFWDKRKGLVNFILSRVATDRDLLIQSIQSNRVRA